MKNIWSNVPEKFRSSSAQLKTPSSLAVCAMLLAITVVLSYFGNVSITLLGTNVIKLSFTVLPIAVAGLMYGPVPAGIIGGLSDIIGFMLMPMGAYIPGFTISMILIGVICGISYYNEQHTIARVCITQLITAVFVSVFLGSLWFVLFYGFDPVTALVTRGLKELIMYPVNVAMIFFIMKGVERLPEIKKIKS